MELWSKLKTTTDTKNKYTNICYKDKKLKLKLKVSIYKIKGYNNGFTNK